ncbi:hypothetical protein ACHAWC_006905, partial [Mediolabrus comicus]
MRNPVNRLATAAPRAFDSILNPSKTGAGTSTEKNVDKSTTTSSTIKEQRNRGSSFHLDLSLLLNINDDNAASSSSVGEETGSVLTFEEMMIMQGSSTSSWDELNSDK